jgi:hypothetical protein
LKIEANSDLIKTNVKKIEDQSPKVGSGFYDRFRTRNNINKNLNVIKDAKRSIEKLSPLSSLEKKKTESKFFKTMVKFYLVKKFIHNLRENTSYRKSDGLQHLHFAMINDLSFFEENNLNRVLNVKIYSNKIIQKMMIFFNNEHLMRLVEIILSKLYGSITMIIHPNNKFRLLWDFLQNLITILYFIIIPIKIAFENNAMMELDTLYFKTLSFSMFLIDIIINFKTAYYSKGELIVSRLKIFNNYLYGRFCTDFLSLTYLISTNLLGVSPHNFEIKLTGLFYLLRLQNLSKAVSRFED